MKVFKKVLGFIGAAVYAAVLCLLLYLLFFWITPWFMNQSGWFVVFTWLVVMPIVGWVFVGFPSAIISFPIALMTNGVKFAKVIPTIIMLFLGFESARLPWLMDSEYTTLMVVKAITMSLIAGGAYLACIIIMYTSDDE